MFCLETPREHSENPTEDDLLFATLDAQDGARVAERYCELLEGREAIPAPDLTGLRHAVLKDVRDQLPEIIVEIMKRISTKTPPPLAQPRSEGSWQGVVSDA